MSVNRNIGRVLILFAAFSLFAAAGLSAQVPSALQRGIGAYQQGRYAEALRDFRTIITNSAAADYLPDAYFWVGKTYIAMEDLDEAAVNLEYYLATFPDHRLRSEGIYQKGRLLYLQNDFEASIQVLYSFVNGYPKDPYLSNGYFWIAESLYNLGHFEEAEKVYGHIVSAFPTSFKVEAARYRLQLIQFKYRENELVKLLKISHEEYLEAVEEFLQREKAYEQALGEYQKRLAVVLSEDLQTELDQLDATVKEQQVTIASLKEQNDQLRSRLSAEEQAALPAEPAPRISATDTDKVRELLEIKAEALELKEYYLGLIEKGGGQ